jgi:hypothetical protein
MPPAEMPVRMAGGPSAQVAVDVPLTFSFGNVIWKSWVRLATFAAVSVVSSVLFPLCVPRWAGSSQNCSQS